MQALKFDGWNWMKVNKGRVDFGYIWIKMDKNGQKMDEIFIYNYFKDMY